jgi:hypothetical protein
LAKTNNYGGAYKVVRIKCRGFEEVKGEEKGTRRKMRTAKVILRKH